MYVVQLQHKHKYRHKDVHMSEISTRTYAGTVFNCHRHLAQQSVGLDTFVCPLTKSTSISLVLVLSWLPCTT